MMLTSLILLDLLPMSPASCRFSSISPSYSGEGEAEVGDALIESLAIVWVKHGQCALYNGRTSKVTKRESNICVFELQLS